MKLRIITPEENLEKLRALDPDKLVIVCKRCGKGISNCQQLDIKWDLVCLNKGCRNTWRLNGTEHSVPSDKELESAEFRRITIREYIRELEEE